MGCLARTRALLETIRLFKAGNSVRNSFSSFLIFGRSVRAPASCFSEAWKRSFQELGDRRRATRAPRCAHPPAHGHAFTVLRHVKTPGSMAPSPSAALGPLLGPRRVARAAETCRRPRHARALAASAPSGASGPPCGSRPGSIPIAQEPLGAFRSRKPESILEEIQGQTSLLHGSVIL